MEVHGSRISFRRTLLLGRPFLKAVWKLSFRSCRMKLGSVTSVLSCIEDRARQVVGGTCWPWSCYCSFGRHKLQCKAKGKIFHHVMKTLGGLRHSSAVLNLGVRWSWVVSFTPMPPYLRGNIPWYSLYRRLSGVWTLWRRIDFIVLMETVIVARKSCGRFKLGNYAHAFLVMWLVLSPLIRMWRYELYLGPCWAFVNAITFFADVIVRSNRCIDEVQSRALCKSVVPKFWRVRMLRSSEILILIPANQVTSSVRAPLHCHTEFSPLRTSVQLCNGTNCWNKGFCIGTVVKYGWIVVKQKYVKLLTAGMHHILHVLHADIPSPLFRTHPPCSWFILSANGMMVFVRIVMYGRNSVSLRLKSQICCISPTAAAVWSYSES
jgi:hypothetical protein